MKNKIEKRKLDHIKLCLSKNVSFKKTTGFEQFELVHNALPEVDFDNISMNTIFLGKKFNYPIFIEAMTGGTEIAKKINRNLAYAAEKLGIGMGIGSQRAMIENRELKYTYYVRDIAPTIFLAGNIGAYQLKIYKLKEIEESLKEIEADALVIHLNPAQEIFQPEGDKNWRGVEEKLKMFCEKLDYPIITKEVGCGISGDVASRLERIGVKAIDVAGAGGTSWIKVEQYRWKKPNDIFSEWGMSTAYCIIECKKTCNLPLIASGGIRNGLDAVKAIALGATLVGIAKPLLKPAIHGKKMVLNTLENFIDEMRRTMFLIGAEKISDIDRRKIKYIAYYHSDTNNL